MAWKINKIVIENFKYFLDVFTIEPHGKHILMYGENGSGKSSIYWAAYTHFQSCLKEPADAGKYFDKTHPYCLINLYDTENRRSGIEIEFVDPLASGSVLFETKDGTYHPLTEEEIMTIDNNQTIR